MNAEYQLKNFEQYQQLQNEINRKERGIKRLSRFGIIKKIFACDIEILSLEIIALHIDQIGLGIKGLIDAEGGDPETLEDLRK